VDFPYLVTCAASALAVPVPGEDAQAILPLHLACEAQLGDDMQCLLAQADHSFLVMETHPLLFFFPVSHPFPFLLLLGYPLIAHSWVLLLESMQPRTHNSYGQERRAQEKVERPCKARTGA
jgi:hypothetical protein